jgi:hypothetical protein
MELGVGFRFQNVAEKANIGVFLSGSPRNKIADPPQ